MEIRARFEAGELRKVGMLLDRGHPRADSSTFLDNESRSQSFPEA